MSTNKFELRLKYISNDRIEYIIKAKPGTRSDKAEWQITKLFYDGDTSRITRIAYANNLPLFQYIADDYFLYKYSPAYETLIIPTKNLPTGTVIDFNGFSSEYNLLKDTPDLLSSAALFNAAPFISVKMGSTVLEKNVSVVWLSETSIKMMVVLHKDVSILVNS